MEPKLSENYPWYYEDILYVMAATKMLNEHVPSLPDSGHGYYIHVELRENHTGTKVGEWSDEIASDAWSFTEKHGDEATS